MRFMGRFPKIAFLFVLSTIGLQLIKSNPLRAVEISRNLMKFEVTAAPKRSKESLKSILNSAAMGIDEYLGKAVHDKTGMMLEHFHNTVNKLGQLLKNQSDIRLDKLNEMELDITHNKLDVILQRMEKFDEYYNFQYVKCVEEKNCDCETRDKYFKHWLDPHSEGRVYMSDFVNNFIFHSSVYNKDDTVFDLVMKLTAKNYAGRRLKWTHNESVQNSIHSFYLYMSRTLSRMYHVTLSLMMEKFRNESSPENLNRASQEISTMLKKYRIDMRTISNTTRRALLRASREIYPDDPSDYVRGNNYDLLRRFVVAFIEIDGPLGKTYQTWVKKIVKEEHSKSLMNSKIYNCSHTEFLRISEICIESENGDRFLHHFKAEEMSNSHPILYGREYIHSKQHLDCFNSKAPFNLCYLDYNQTDHLTVRKFMKSPVKASFGHVVTGIKWFVRENIFNLQIQEGKLIRGNILLDTLKWKPIIREDTENDIVLDYYNRSFNLDDIILPHDCYLTGVQFHQNGDTITLRVFGQNVTDNGNLDPGSIQLFEPDLKNRREEIKLDGLDISTNAPHDRQHKMQGSPGKSFIKFQVTDLKKDAGQTTIPFFDTQEVVTIPPAPLGGVGVYYKGMPGYGGFLGLKLISLDMIPILDNDAIEDNFTSIERQLVHDKRAIIG